MADSRADEIIKRHERLKSERSVWESHWQEIAERIWPDRALFQGERTAGEKRTEKVFDATAALALTRFAAAMESMLTPRTTKWHKLATSDEELNEVPAVQRYLDEVANILFRVRYASSANFASQMHESYMSIGAFGTGGMITEDLLGVGIRYKSVDLAGLYFCENRHGLVDTVHRGFKYTARQARQHFKKIPEKIAQACEKQPDQLFDFIHCVLPSSELNEGKRGAGMPFASFYVCLDTRTIVEDGGYRTMPYSIGRYITTPGETYGRSPAMLVLPDVKMLNEMSKTIMRAGQKVVDPPLLLQEDGALSGFDLRSGALNFGGVDDQGRETVKALQTGARVDIGLDMMEQRRQVINDAFLVTLFQILVDAPQMTATEAMLRAQEKGALLAPTMGRQQSEMLGPLIEREIDILARAGMLPPMPRELAERGGEVEIEYVSPLNRAQRAEDGVAIMRTAEAAGVIAQFEPRALRAYNWVEAVKELGDINGMPAKFKFSDEEMEAMDEQQAAQMQAAQLLQAAPIAAQTAKTMAETQQLASQGQPVVQ